MILMVYSVLTPRPMKNKSRMGFWDVVIGLAILTL